MSVQKMRKIYIVIDRNTGHSLASDRHTMINIVESKRKVQQLKAGVF